MAIISLIFAIWKSTGEKNKIRIFIILNQNYSSEINSSALHSGFEEKKGKKINRQINNIVLVFYCAICACLNCFSLLFGEPYAWDLRLETLELNCRQKVEMTDQKMPKVLELLVYCYIWELRVIKKLTEIKSGQQIIARLTMYHVLAKHIIF